MGVDSGKRMRGEKEERFECTVGRGREMRRGKIGADRGKRMRDEKEERCE